ncbi:MAG: hypothetical protein IIW36_01025 [Clostridia bacterium]|jgi:hypothetical protein|nr:hypothetical protein [Clostridia bacterium]MBQ5833368.1 hypothetical protein [Clostridia bacterium]
MSNSSLSRFGIRLAYLMPLVTFLLLVIYGLIPHLYFIYQDVAYETMSLFTMVGNTWRECRATLSESGGSASAVLFSYTMTAATVLFWGTLILHGIFSFASAICSVYAFSRIPTDRLTNRAKRILQLICPNRAFFVIGGLLPLLYATFPLLLRHCYREQMSMSISIHATTGVMDPIPAILLVLLGTSLFLATLPLQKREHLDLFRLYKQKSKDKTN